MLPWAGLMLHLKGQGKVCSGRSRPSSPAPGGSTEIPWKQLWGIPLCAQGTRNWAICPGLTHGVGRAMALKRVLITHFVPVCVHQVLMCGCTRTTLALRGFSCLQKLSCPATTLQISLCGSALPVQHWGAELALTVVVTALRKQWRVEIRPKLASNSSSVSTNYDTLTTKSGWQPFSKLKYLI